MSTTYLGIYAMVLGALAQLLGVPVVEGDLEIFVKVALAFAGAAIAMVGRYRLGGVTFLGARKS